MQVERQSVKCFVTDGSERSVQDTVSKLKFLAKIKEGEKIDVQSLQVVTADSWGSRLYRTLIARGESREATLEFVRGVVGEAFDLATRYITREDDFFRQVGDMIIQALQESKQGLSNLTETYKDDRMYTSRIDTLIGTISTKTGDIQRQFAKHDEVQTTSDNEEEVHSTSPPDSPVDNSRPRRGGAGRGSSRR